GSLLSRVRRLAGSSSSPTTRSPWSAANLIACVAGVALALGILGWYEIAETRGDRSPTASDGTAETETAGNHDNVNPAGVADEAPETGDSQIVAWSMLVDGTLVDTVAKFGRDELPRQGAFRVLPCSAAKLRSALFDPAQAAHVHADVQNVQVL